MSEKDIIIMRDGLKLAAKVSIPNTEKYDVVILAYGFVGMMDPKVNDPLPVLTEKLQKKRLSYNYIRL